VTGVQALDWALLSPVVVPVVALLAVLVVEAVVPGRRGVLDVLTLAGLLGAAVALSAVARGRDLPDGTLCVGVLPGGGDVCSFTLSGLTVALQGVVLLAAVVCLLLALDGPGARMRAEHHVLLLAATSGALALAGARDLATIVVALETASLPVVGLIALRRDARGAEAALKLLLVAVASLGILLLGVALLYAGTGALHLPVIAAAVPAGGGRALVLLGTALVVAGVAFKVSAMPFGWWTPDVYAGSPVPVAAFLSTVSKAAATAAIVVVLVAGVPLLVADWATVLGWLAAATMTIGNLVALRQRVAVRLLAWSTVAQAGWVLLPLAGATASPSRAAAASVGYLLAYAAASLAA
jgi:NADH-quinone oxidoreductase subunit N